MGPVTCPSDGYSDVTYLGDKVPILHHTVASSPQKFHHTYLPQILNSCSSVVNCVLLL